MKSALITIAAIALGATAANASPIVVNAEPLPSVHVSYADLDLASLDGRVRLEERIRAAAESVCITRENRDVESWLEDHGCYQAAIASGRRQMDQAVARSAAFAAGMGRRSGH